MKKLLALLCFAGVLVTTAGCDWFKKEKAPEPTKEVPVPAPEKTTPAPAPGDKS